MIDTLIGLQLPNHHWGDRHIAPDQIGLLICGDFEGEGIGHLGDQGIVAFGYVDSELGGQFPFHSKVTESKLIIKVVRHLNQLFKYKQFIFDLFETNKLNLC